MYIFKTPAIDISGSELKETKMSSEEMPPMDETVSVARHNTFVKLAPVTNWEWEREGDGGEIFK